MAENELPPSLQKHQSSESVSSTVTGCGWLQLKHELYFPDDEVQTVPAADTFYRVIGANGSRHEGTLDASGCASLQGVGHGTVVVEYEPDIDKEIKQLQKEIKTALDEMIAEEHAESAVIQKRLDSQWWITNRAEYKWAEIKGIGNGIWGLGEAIWGGAKALYALDQTIKQEVGKYVLDPLNAPETFDKDLARVKKEYKELEKFVDEDLETYYVFLKDKETWSIFYNFAKDYIGAQHSLEVAEAGGEAAFAIILTVLTAGAGGAAAAGNAGAKMAKLGRLISNKIT